MVIAPMVFILSISNFLDTPQIHVSQSAIYLVLSVLEFPSCALLPIMDLNITEMSDDKAGES